MTKTELLQYWFDEVWGKGNFSAVEEMLSPDVKINGVLPSHDLNKSDYPDLVQTLFGLIGPVQVRFLQAIEEGDWISATYVVHTERMDTGAPLKIPGQVMVRFSGNQIAESHSNFDFFALFEELGQLPPDALPVCMTGQRLRWA